MMEERILLTLGYDGTAYCGWQVQENGETVQGALIRALSVLFGTGIDVLGASRTDAGVHALGQRALVTLPANMCKVPLDKLPAVVNAKLPNDVVVTRAERAGEGFHPIFDAKRKTYTYDIHNAPYAHPFMRRYAHHVRAVLNVDAMNRAAACFVGTHDFEAFRATGGTTKTSVRTMYSASVTRDGEWVRYTVTGSGFLYNMVRIMAGTLIFVGMGKLAADDMPGILALRDRTRAGVTAPPQGLTLVRVEYE